IRGDLVTGVQTCALPIFTREHREALYEAHVVREVLVFELWLHDEDRCVGEAYLSGIAWPRASAEVTLGVFAAEDRGRGLGPEARSEERRVGKEWRARVGW